MNGTSTRAGVAAAIAALLLSACTAGGETELVVNGTETSPATPSPTGTPSPTITQP